MPHSCLRKVFQKNDGAAGVFGGLKLVSFGMEIGRDAPEDLHRFRLLQFLREPQRIRPSFP